MGEKYRPHGSGSVRCVRDLGEMRSFSTCQVFEGGDLGPEGRKMVRSSKLRKCDKSGLPRRLDDSFEHVTVQ